MNFEKNIELKNKIPSIEGGEQPADFLSRLEKQGKYLFHGSPHEIVELEPRQTTDSSGEEWNIDQAIFATPRAVWAVAHAIVEPLEKTKGPAYFSTSDDEQNENIFILKKTPNINLQKGKVYILSRSGFEPKFEEFKNKCQWKSKENTNPLTNVEVTEDDFKKLGGMIKIVEK